MMIDTLALSDLGEKLEEEEQKWGLAEHHAVTIYQPSVLYDSNVWQAGAFLIAMLSVMKTPSNLLICHVLL